MRRIEFLATTRSDLVLTWPEWFMTPLLLWPKQHPATEGQSQTAHTAAEAEVPMYMSQKASSPMLSKSECDPVAYGTYQRVGNVSPTTASEPYLAPLYV